MTANESGKMQFPLVLIVLLPTPLRWINEENPLIQIHPKDQQAHLDSQLEEMEQALVAILGQRTFQMIKVATTTHTIQAEDLCLV